MKAFWTFRTVVMGLALWATQTAFGYELSHDYYNRFRTPYRNNVYLSQQVTAARSDISLDGKSNDRFDGYGLQLSAGMEHMRFIQTGAFFSTTQLTHADVASSEARMLETGCEAKMVMSTPVANVVVGAAGVLARGNIQKDEERMSLSGSGVRGVFELNQYASSQVSLMLGVSHTVMNFSGKNSKGLNVKPAAATTRVGAGLTVWL
ncbi:MAG: hypothetical protein RIR26_1725 [Pseudomonadota bacterium]